MKQQSILGFSSAILCLFVSIAACDKVNLTDAMKVVGQPAGSQTAKGGTSGGGVAGVSTIAQVAGQAVPVSPSIVAKLGNFFYNREIKNREDKNEIEQNTEVNEQMNKVFNRLKEVAQNDPKYGQVAKEMDWKLNTIRDKAMINAKAFSGGGVVIYEGIIPIAKVEGALAALLGHEVIHVLARHDVKRLSGDVAAGAAVIGPSIAAGMGEVDPKIVGPVAGALGVGYLFGVRHAWERSDEHDADCDGLQLAAEAGYDPKKVYDFWERMKNATAEEKKTYRFLDDHPITDERLIYINSKTGDNKSCMERAVEAYKNSLIKLQANDPKNIPNSSEELQRPG